MNQDYYNLPQVNNIEGRGDYPEKVAFFIKQVEIYSKTKNSNDLKILDVGCHQGKMSLQFKKYGTVYGIDLNKKAIKKAIQNGIKAQVADVFNLDTIFKENTFDVITAGDIIEHVFDTDLFLKKLHFILKKGGVLLLSTPNLVSLGRRLMTLIGKNPYCEYSAKQNGINVGHIRYYTLDDLKLQLQEIKFHDIKIITDTTNIPVRIIDSMLLKLDRRLGRELYATAYK